MADSKPRTSASTDAATDGVTRVQIVTRGEALREHMPDERARVLTEAAMPGARMLQVAQRYGSSLRLVYLWRRKAVGHPARQALLRALRFVPLLVNDGGPQQGTVVPPSAPMPDAGTDRIEVVGIANLIVQ